MITRILFQLVLYFRSVAILTAETAVAIVEVLMCDTLTKGIQVITPTVRASEIALALVAFLTGAAAAGIVLWWLR